ncbi:hypothetical protein [Vagococcus intermedius]|uniref:Uncharacterized protein n=1 Tax=Vagococcus intermedius TaxID=2991418 RepID=A0AAF0CX52_9ENTE|nr:hypothetical protein [Vagococcus intermedius]WEG74377.1 hypothetical protein OL234_10755 [Vagococcus intermedius]WEG76499.1 hypothetical protein OL235_10920 [Vagococcus intermedius]
MTKIKDKQDIIALDKKIYKRFLKDQFTKDIIDITDNKILVTYQTKKEWDQLLKKLSKPVSIYSDKNPYKSAPKKKKKRLSKSAFIKKQKKDYHQRHWKGMAYGDKTQAGEVTVEKIK